MDNNGSSFAIYFKFQLKVIDECFCFISILAKISVNKNKNCVAGQHNYLAIHAFLKKRYTETSFIYRMSSVLSESENIYPGVFKLLSLNMVSQFRNVSDRQIISNLFKQRGIKFLKNYENLCSHVPVTHRKMFLKSAFGPRFNPTLSCELSNGS